MSVFVDGVTPLNAAKLNELQNKAEKGVVNGYPSLDADGLVPVSQLPPMGGVLVQSEFTYNGTTTAPPSSGQLRMNNADQTLPTKLYIHKSTAPGVDIGSALLAVKTGDLIYVQDKDDGSQWRLYTAAANAIDQTTYVEVTVTYTKGGSALNTGQRVILAIKHPESAAAGMDLVYEGAWAAGAYQDGDIVVKDGV